MDQFEETVVNPNISLNNFEVKVCEHEEKTARYTTPVNSTSTKPANKNYKAFLLLAILSSILIYQITVIL